jgi:hypothetical protein
MRVIASEPRSIASICPSNRAEIDRFRPREPPSGDRWLPSARATAPRSIGSIGASHRAAIGGFRRREQASRDRSFPSARAIEQ